MSLPVIILGAGGHAKVLIDVLHASRAVIAGIVDSEPALAGSSLLSVPVLGNDDILTDFSPSEVQLVNALGSVGLPTKRRQLFERFKGMGYFFATVVHPSAVVALDVELGEGTQIMAGAVVQPGCRIGINSIINTRVSVDHDCIIGDHVHIAPGVTLSGGVKVGAGSHIGTGVTVIHGISIGIGCLLSAGSVVIRDVIEGTKVRGVPAREVI